MSDDSTDESGTHAGTDGLPDKASPVRRSRAHRVAIWSAFSLAIVLAGAVALAMGTGRTATLSPLCGSCHEIASQVAAWEASSHAKIGCRSCHETYALRDGIARKVSKTSQLASAFFGGDYFAFETTGAVTGDQVEIPDVVCEGCHTIAREPSVRDGILIDHYEHSRRNRSCLSCHARTTHPEPGVDLALAMMTQCFACHSQSDEAEATGACDSCHPEYFELVPTSHEPEAWTPAHGQASIADPEQCRMCHSDGHCTDCHGVLMPHPQGWTTDRDTGHASLSRTDADVCANCHEARPNSCDTCHHGPYDTLPGPWIETHGAIALETGTVVCIECHTETYCDGCHGP